MSDSRQAFPYADFLDQFEEAIYWHIAWYSRGIRHLMFSDGPADDLVGKDAHNHCRLGCFLHRFPSPPGCDEMVEQIEELHEQMHALMRDALLEARSGMPIGKDSFCEIEEAQSLFFNTLHGLFRKVMEDHCTEIAQARLAG